MDKQPSTQQTMLQNTIQKPTHRFFLLKKRAIWVSLALIVVCALVTLSSAWYATSASAASPDASKAKRILQVNPKGVGLPGQPPCKWQGNEETLICHVTISAPKSNHGNLTWRYVAKDGDGIELNHKDVQIQPGNRVLSPGQQVQLTILSGFFFSGHAPWITVTFVGPSNSVTVQVNCNC